MCHLTSQCLHSLQLQGRCDFCILFYSVVFYCSLMSLTLYSRFNALTAPSLPPSGAKTESRESGSSCSSVSVPSCVDLAAASGYWTSTLFMLEEGAVKGLQRTRGEKPAAGTVLVFLWVCGVRTALSYPLGQGAEIECVISVCYSAVIVWYCHRRHQYCLTTPTAPSLHPHPRSQGPRSLPTCCCTALPWMGDLRYSVRSCIILP